MRTAGLLATGAVAVHELRYLAAGPAADAGAAHGYLPAVALLSTILLGLACAQIAAVVERARRTGSAGRPLDAAGQAGFLTTWGLAALALMLIFFAQESLEGLLAGGDEGVLAGGGWIPLPISLAVGALLALASVGARSAVAAAARDARRAAPSRHPPSRPRVPCGHPPAGPPVARHLAARAPPCVLH